MKVGPMKVELVVTREGWTKKIWLGNDLVATQTHKMESASCSIGCDEGELVDQIPYGEFVDDDLLEALDDLDGFDIASQLQMLEAAHVRGTSEASPSNAPHEPRGTETVNNQKPQR